MEMKSHEVMRRCPIGIDDVLAIDLRMQEVSCLNKSPAV